MFFLSWSIALLFSAFPPHLISLDFWNPPSEYTLEKLSSVATSISLPTRNVWNSSQCTPLDTVDSNPNYSYFTNSLLAHLTSPSLTPMSDSQILPEDPWLLSIYLLYLITFSLLLFRFGMPLPTM
ncbi:hypothetical protein CRE_30131 [Caenorhabditis remanei]|uniref:Uncharacterized protein n=1 Tax=Caenorhabditis remanei TaxID=31234 RepID=E3N633_CAERE|nr:hypothetical protein CRE_30131 [Caenorhabditis remanei]